ncbi:MAG: PAS domain S-box protein [Anaerolineales bacterium]|nr:PAS domain S-box protein [Anaerolineales bacterium]
MNHGIPLPNRTRRTRSDGVFRYECADDPSEQLGELRFPSPVLLSIIAAVAVFAGELAIMLWLPQFLAADPRVDALVDALLMGGFVAFIYWLYWMGYASHEMRRAQSQHERMRVQLAGLHAAGHGIAITDRDGVIEWVNPAFTKITGYACVEAVGQGLRELLGTPAADDAVNEKFFQTIYAGQVYQGELTRRRKDGTLYVEEQTVAPVKNRQGEITHFIAIKNDTTERKNLEAQLELHARQLEALGRIDRKARATAETLAEASHALAQTLQVQAVLEVLLQYLHRLVPYEHGCIAMLDADDNLVMRVMAGSDGNVDRTSSLPTKAIELVDCRDLKPLLAGSRSVIVNDVFWAGRWELPAMDVSSRWVLTPLRADEKFLGVCLLQYSSAETLDADRLQVIEIIMNIASGSIRNALQFEQIAADRERMQALSRRLVEVQEEERRKIARELHDQAGQALTSMRLCLGQLQRHADDPSAILAGVAELQTINDEVMEDLHRLAMDLRPATLDRLGVVPALASYFDRINASERLRVQFTVTDRDRRLPSAVETAVYRVACESTTNVLKHAGAKNMSVLLRMMDDRVILMIEDDGRGFDMSLLGQDLRLGLIGMQERFETLGGTLIVESTPGNGSTLVGEIPCDMSNPDRR